MTERSDDDFRIGVCFKGIVFPEQCFLYFLVVVDLAVIYNIVGVSVLRIRHGLSAIFEINDRQACVRKAARIYDGMTVGVRPAVVHRIDHTGQCMKVLLGIFRIVLVWVKVARNATHTDAPSHFFLLYSFSARLFRIMYNLEADGNCILSKLY